MTLPHAKGKIKGGNILNEDESTLRKESTRSNGPAAVPLGLDWGNFRRVARLLKKLDAQVYLVGGAVRDLLQGREEHDLDFAVPDGAIALARKVSDRLGGAFVLLDREHDTGRVILSNVWGGPVSIDFAGFRGPEITEDLRLRDFTINAMALNVRELEKGGAIRPIDPLGGQSDLAAGVIRATSPRAIEDDPVRALRAVRLAGELGFVIEPSTADLLRESAPALGRVSAERLRDELCKILGQPDAAGQIRTLAGLRLLEQTLPEMPGSTGSPAHLLGCALERIEALEALLACTFRSAAPDYSPQIGSAVRVLAPFSALLDDHLSSPTSGERSRLMFLKLAALLGDPAGEYPDNRTGAAVAEEMSLRLRFSKKEIRLLKTLAARYRLPYELLQSVPTPGADPLTRRAVYRFFRDAEETGPDLLLLSLADSLGEQKCGRGNADLWDRHLETASCLLKNYRDNAQTVISPPPLLTGHDLLHDFGLSAGPDLGRILEGLREEQAAGEVSDRREALDYVARQLSRPSEPDDVVG